MGGPGDASTIKRMLDEGYRFIQAPSDLAFLQLGLRGFFDNVKAVGVQHKDPVPMY